MIGDFDNRTADPVFDGTLRQGLAVQLEQSPFLSVLSEQRLSAYARPDGPAPERAANGDIGGV